MRSARVFPILLTVFASAVAQEGGDVQTMLIEHQASALNHAGNCMNDAKDLPKKETPAETVSIDRDYIARARPLWTLLEQLRLSSSVDQNFFDLAEKADSVLASLPEGRTGFGDAALCLQLGTQLSDILDYRVTKNRSAALMIDEKALLVAQSLDIADWLAAGKMTGLQRSLPARKKINAQLTLDTEKVKRRIRNLQKADPDR